MRAIHRRTAPGAAPGSVVVDPNSRPPEIRLTAYDSQRIVERSIGDPAEIRNYLGGWPTIWVEVDGLGDAKTIEALGEIFGLHRLALEDVVNVHQRPKVETYEEHLFIVARMVSWHGHLDTEQLSIFLGTNFVLTFQEQDHPGDCLGPLRQRLREGRGPTRAAGPGYLAYALLDAVVDAYFPVLEHYGERLEAIESQVIEGAGGKVVRQIHDIKHDLLHVRRAIWPQREAVNQLVRDHNRFINAETRVYLRDCYDHTVQLIDLVETFRELGTDLRDFYLSAVSNRMNLTIRLLTVISTIFIPLTFIAGIYGMNFDPNSSPWNMPELRWRYGYPLALGLMAALGCGLLFYFWRAGWLSDRQVEPERAEPAARRVPEGRRTKGPGSGEAPGGA
jgi:magnesium transporter